MEKLNKHNYESYFLDFIEGKLSESQIIELKKFLDKNPVLEKELNDFEDLRLQPENIIFNHKKELIKTAQSKHFEINDFEYLCVADIEKDITEEEKTQLSEKVEEGSEYIKDLKLFKNTKLSPDPNIKYPNKKQLMRRYLPVNFKVVSTLAAAVIALLLVLNLNGLLNESSGNSGDLPVSGYRIYKHKQVQISNNSENTYKQETIVSHNQTIKQTNNNDLAFVDNESLDKENIYKELTVSIPDIKKETLIFSEYKNDLIKSSTYYPVLKNEKSNKELLWQYAETGINVWKSISSSEFEMNNIYQEDGSIEKLNLTASNFKISRTFYKNR